MSEDTDQPESVIEKLARELEGRPVEHWLARDPHLLGDLAFKDAIIRAQDQMLAEQPEQPEQKPKIPAREVLRLFDERRKVDPRTRLKPFCKELGANFDSIRVAK
jgi:hypothetical protein